MISKHGFYVLKKSDVSDEQLKVIRRDLDIKPVAKPFRIGRYVKPVETVDLLCETKSAWHVPRFYGATTFGAPSTVELSRGAVIDVPFRGSLFANQREPIDAVLTRLRSDAHESGGLLSLPCGEGKTVSALYIVSVIARKTLIVVHKEFLMNQWLQEISEFLPTARVGHIQGKVYDVSDKDIVLAMIQTLSRRDYPFEDMSQFGLAVYDECHHLGARVFSRALQKVPAWCMLGLSAEPQRKDGMNLVFEYSLGTMIYQRERETSGNVDVFQIRVSSTSEKFEEKFDRTGNKMMYKMEENVVTHPLRNQLLVDVIASLCRDERRQVLVLSARNSGHLPVIEEMVRTQCPHLDVGYYIGRNGLNKKRHTDMLEASKSCRVILATYDMAMEGLNIKSLNTLLLASPLVGLTTQKVRGEERVFCNDIKQTVGRILRDRHSDMPRIVVDVVDCFSNYYGWAQQRERYYRKEKYRVLTYAHHLERDGRCAIDFAHPPPPLARADSDGATSSDSDCDDGGNDGYAREKPAACMFRIHT